MTEIKPGFYRMSNLEYHRGPGVSKSTLWTFYTYSPLHSQVPVEITPAMEFGTMLHDACEDPDAFEGTYVIQPDDCRPGSGAGMKARKEAFEASVAANNQTVIKQEDYDAIRGMVASIHGNQDCIELLTGEGEHELSGYWIHPDTEVLCKCRPDFINKDKRIVVDFKSCTDARPGPFYNHAWSMGYGFQAAWYLYGISQITGVPHNKFYLVAVERKSPFGVQAHPVWQEVIDYWLSKLTWILTRYKECLDSEVWPSYESQSPGLGLSPWEKRELEFDNY